METATTFHSLIQLSGFTPQKKTEKEKVICEAKIEGMTPFWLRLKTSRWFVCTRGYSLDMFTAISDKEMTNITQLVLDDVHSRIDCPNN